MSRRIVFKLLLVVVAIFSLLVLSSVLSAQGRSDDAFERVRKAQERHTDRLMAKPGVVGTAVGLNQNGRHVVMVLLEKPGVGGIPTELDGVPVRPVVTGKIYALKPPTNRPPKPPRGLTATAVSQSQINLDWRDNREAGVVYNVYRSTTSGSYGDPIEAVTSSRYSDTGLTPSTTYYYVVTAKTTGGESAYSDEASATTESGTVELPAAPTGLTATAVSSSQIDLTWTDNADNEAGFKIELDSVQIDTVGANVTTYSDTGLDPSRTYTYRVRAYNGAGDSAYSDPASATTEAAPEKPPHWCKRPVPIGVSTGHPDITAGTIGCRVIDNGGNVYALSNNHVYADENKGIEGVDPVIQPGTYDGGASPADDIGTLADFEPIVFHPRANNTIDAAIALSSTAELGDATPAGDPDYPDGYGTPKSETVPAYVGLAVQKYGRTTGLTTGVVDGINATVRVRYDSGQTRFVGQILIIPGGFSAGGDSGSLVVCDDDGGPDDRKAVGLLFAGSASYTIANPIDEVLARFGVTIDGE